MNNKQIEAAAEAIYNVVPCTFEDSIPSTDGSSKRIKIDVAIPWEKCRADDDEYINLIYEKAKAALEASEQHAWQPIEMAPRDGSGVTLTDGDDVVIASWNFNEWVPDNAYSSDSACSLHISFEPTLWQPLPTPPKEQ